jgi:hypothetical protein
MKMKGKGKWWVIGVGLLVLLVSSTALAGSVAAHKRFQRTFVCVKAQRADQGHLTEAAQSMRPGLEEVPRLRPLR